MFKIDPKAIERVNGPSWEKLRPVFVKLGESLLAAGPSTGSQLTTIYVKFTIGREPSSPVFAVVWLKTSKRLVVGLSMPKDFTSEFLGAAPGGMSYKGLTHYLILEPADVLPKEFDKWAKTAYDCVLSHKAVE